MVNTSLRIRIYRNSAWTNSSSTPVTGSGSTVVRACGYPSSLRVIIQFLNHTTSSAYVLPMYWFGQTYVPQNWPVLVIPHLRFLQACCHQSQSKCNTCVAQFVLAEGRPARVFILFWKLDQTSVSGNQNIRKSGQTSRQLDFKSVSRGLYCGIVINVSVCEVKSHSGSQHELATLYCLYPCTCRLKRYPPTFKTQFADQHVIHKTRSNITYLA